MVGSVAAILDISARKIQYKLKEYQQEGAVRSPERARNEVVTSE